MVDVFAEVSEVRDKMQAAVYSVQSLLGSTLDSMQSLMSKLDAQVSALDEKQTRMREMQSTMTLNTEKTSPRIKLNLRGKIFETYRETLLHIEDTYFHAILSSGVWQPDAEGAYFIDQPPEGFDRIIEYLRSGVLSLEGLNKYEAKCVKRNMDYFRIPTQVKAWDYSSHIEVNKTDFEVVTILELSDGRICIGGGGGSLKIWSEDPGKCLSLLGSATDTDCLVELLDGRLCSSSNEDMVLGLGRSLVLRIWNVTTGACELTLKGQTRTVTTMCRLTDGRVCIGGGSHDASITIWNIASGLCEYTMRGNNNGICCLLQLCDGRLCSCGGDGTIKLWNMSARKCVLTMIGHKKAVHQVIQLLDGRLCSCSADKTIKLWDSESGVCQKSFIAGSGVLPSMVLVSDNRVCISFFDHPEFAMKIWNLETEECEFTLLGHTGYVQSIIRLRDGRICSGSADKTIRIWY
jgi:WD40 repeat protein